MSFQLAQALTGLALQQAKPVGSRKDHIALGSGGRPCRRIGYNPPGMWDEVNTLRKAIRRPMRKWWKRVGVWWLGAILLVLVIEGTSKVLCYLVLNQSWYAAHSSSAFVNYLHRHSGLLIGASDESCIAITQILTLLLGLLAAQAADTTIKQLYSTVAAPGIEMRVRLRYSVSCIAAWPVLVVAVLIGSGLWQNILGWITDTILGNQVSELWGEPYYASHQMFLGLLILLAWLIALLVATSSIRWPLIWCLVFILPLIYAHIAALVESSTGFYGLVYLVWYAGLAHAIKYPGLFELDFAFGWLLGGALAVGLFWAILAGRRRLALALFVVVCSAAFLHGFSRQMVVFDMPPFYSDPAVKLTSDLPMGLDLLRGTGDFTGSPIASVVYPSPHHGPPDENLVIAFPNEHRFNLRSDPTWLAVLINLAYIALHYVFIWFLLGWLPQKRE